jgi:hypothetical protein
MHRSFPSTAPKKLHNEDRKPARHLRLHNRNDVGLEYTIVTVTCFFPQRGGASGGDLVLVRESAEDLFSADPVLSEVDLRWPGVSLSGCELAEGTVGAGLCCSCATRRSVASLVQRPGTRGDVSGSDA